MKISKSRIYKILNTHNQSIRKPRKAHKEKERFNKSRKGKKKQRNIRYRTLKKGGARIKLDDTSSATTELLAGYQSALSSYVDSLKKDNTRTEAVLSGDSNPETSDYFSGILNSTLAKGISKEIQKAQDADQSVIEGLMNGIGALFTREDSGAKQSFTEQLNDIVEREKLINVVQNRLTYEAVNKDSRGKILIEAFTKFLASISGMGEMIQRFGFGVGMDAYLDLEISKQEVVVDQSINATKEKIDELRLRMDSITNQQKAELKTMLDDMISKINVLLAMLSLFSAFGGGGVSVLDYQNSFLEDFTDNPASTGAMAFAINQKTIHNEAVEALTKRLEEDITFYPGKDGEPLITTNVKNNTESYKDLIVIPRLSVKPVETNSWKTRSNALASADLTSDSPAPDQKLPDDPDAKARAQARMDELERQKTSQTGDRLEDKALSTTAIVRDESKSEDDTEQQYSSPIDKKSIISRQEEDQLSKTSSSSPSQTAPAAASSSVKEDKQDEPVTQPTELVMSELSPSSPSTNDGDQDQSTDTEPPPSAASQEQQSSKADEPVSEATENVPFPNAVPVNRVCSAVRDNEEYVASGSCAPKSVFINYFTVLGIDVPKNWDESFARKANKAYNRLALKNHPDKTTDPVKRAKFKCISEAKEVFKDEEVYNRYMRLMSVCTDEAKTGPQLDKPSETINQQIGFSDPNNEKDQDKPTSDPPVDSPTDQPADQLSSPTSDPPLDSPTDTQIDLPADQLSSPTSDTPVDSPTDLQTDTPADQLITQSQEVQPPSREPPQQSHSNGVSTESTTSQLSNGDVEVNIRVKIPKDAQFSINGNAGSSAETALKGLVDNINQNGGTKKKKKKQNKNTRRKRH